MRNEDFRLCFRDLNSVIIKSSVRHPTTPRLPSVSESQDHLPNDIEEEALQHAQQSASDLILPTLKNCLEYELFIC
jgi:hypothetical protein